MILKTKVEILNWLKKYDGQYKKNIETNCYELIDIHDIVNQSLLEKMIQQEHLPLDYFESLKNEGHQYIVNANGSINISNEELQEIPIQFYHVEGNFDCSHNQLISLKGCPQYIGGSFYCHNNQIISLKYCPSSVYGDFDCSSNQIKSLEYCPHFVEGNFFCHKNKLTSLEYFPEFIKGFVFLDNNRQLLKYKKDTNDINILKLSDDKFLKIGDFKFWQQFHLEEKANKEYEKIMHNLNLHEQKENSNFYYKRKKL